MARGQFEFFQLRCFVAVAEELNFRRAAERLNMTQPPLSRQIKLLEHALGLQLFERSNRQVSLTPAGKSFLGNATDILQRAEYAALLAKQAERGQVGTIAMGFVPSAALEFVPRIVSALREALPGVTFNPTEMMSYEIVEALNSGQIDLGLTRSSGRQLELDSVRVVSEPFVLAVPATHLLARKESPAVADLDGADFVSYSTERGGFVREMLNALFAGQGVSLRTAMEVSQTHSVVALVNRDIGAAFVPSSTQAMRMQNVVYRPVDLPDWFRSELYLITGRKRREALHTRVRDIILSALKAYSPQVPV